MQCKVTNYFAFMRCVVYAIVRLRILWAAVREKNKHVLLCGIRL